MSAARDLATLGNQNALKVDTTDTRIGINSTSPDSTLDVVGNVEISGVTTFSGVTHVGSGVSIYPTSGIVSATAFYGDGSNLDGVASAGLGTAIDSESTDGLGVIYYTNKTIAVGATITVDVPSSSDSKVAYTQWEEIAPADTADVIVADGDDLVLDILGLSTGGITPMSGSGGRIRAGTFTNKAGTGAPSLTYGAELPVGYGLTGAGGVNITGVVTATEFSGTTGTFSGNVTIGGTLTYEDVTNIDVVGVSTFAGRVNGNSTLEANEGLNVTAGVTTIAGNQTVAGTATFAKKTTVNATLNATEGLHVSAGVVTAAGAVSAAGAITGSAGVDVSGGQLTVGSAVTIGSAGVTTFHAGANFSQGGILREKVYINSTAFNQSTAGTLEVNLDEGMVHYRSTAIDSASTVPNIMSNVGVNTVMAVGDILNVTIITEADNTSYFINAITIDGQAVTEDWVGGAAPTDGGGSATDTYSFNIMKIGSSGTYNNDYVVVANQSKTSS